MQAHDLIVQVILLDRRCIFSFFFAARQHVHDELLILRPPLRMKFIAAHREYWS